MVGGRGGTFRTSAKKVKIFSDGKRKEENIEVTLREIRELRTEERKDKR